MAFGLNHRRAMAFALGLAAWSLAAEGGIAVIAWAQTPTAAPATEEALGTRPVAVTRPGEAVPVIEAPSVLPEPAAGAASASVPPATEATVAATPAEPAPAVPDEQADAEPVLTIDPVLEGISASRPVLRGLDKLLARPAIAARPERPGSVGDPELEGFADAAAVKLEPPVSPDDPVWRARSRPPVAITGSAASPEVHGETGLRGFLARAGAEVEPEIVIEMR